MATATSTSLAALQALGQSVWLDDISRKMLDTGELKRLIEEDGLQGMTSNPSIFQKAIGSGTEYDEEVQNLIGLGDGIETIYEGLTVADIRRALDEFRPVYDRTNGGDGFVSLEVSPLLAHDTAATIAEAKKLWGLLGRPNAMIKIPGTPEGLAAIEEALFSGLNVNVTLLFSVEAYRAVAETYLKALKRRVEKGLPVDRIASVASFFVSRIDTEVDNRIEAKLKEAKDPATKAKLEGLLGKAAIANAKNAYSVYETLFHGPEFAALKAKGAHPQRVLWASVSTKNKKYPDTLYTDGLIGPETVSTMPMSAFLAFKDHGHASPTLLEGREEAKKVMADLASVGIDFKDVTDKLLRDGVKVFADSFHELFETHQGEAGEDPPDPADRPDAPAGRLREAGRGDPRRPRAAARGRADVVEGCDALEVGRGARQGHQERPGLAQRRRRRPREGRRARAVQPRDRRRRLQAHRRHGHGRLEPVRRGPAPDEHPGRGPSRAARARQHGARDDPPDRVGDRRREDPLRRLEQERHDDRALGLLRDLLREGEGDQGREGGRELRRDHRPRHEDGGRRPPRRLPADLPQPERHRRPLLGPLLLRHGPRRADGPRRRRRCSTTRRSRSASAGPRSRSARTPAPCSARCSASWRPRGETR